MVGALPGRDERRGVPRRIAKTRYEPPALLQKLRRARHDQPPGTGFTDIHGALPTCVQGDGAPELARSVLPIRDGLPKLKDFPAHFGGSGERVAE